VAYYSERYEGRKPISGTYEITIDRYQLLFKVCERYFTNLAWRFPALFHQGIYSEPKDLIDFLKYKKPDLFNVSCGILRAPKVDSYSEEQEDYDQSAFLDFIEFVARHCKTYKLEKSDDCFDFPNPEFIDNDDTAFLSFQKEINDVFQMTNLLYRLNDKKEVERIIEHSPLTPEVETALLSVKEPGLRELLNEAMSYHRSYRESDRKVAVDKIWKAFERLKTYYCEKLPGKPEDNKQGSAKEVIKAIVKNVPQKSNETFNNEFTKEFKELTRIGNDYLIRHSETYKTDVSDLRHYDYFFNRCLSLIALAIPYLE